MVYACVSVAALTRRDIAVDLGTTTTLVYVRGRGIVLVEPSLLALDAAKGKIRAVGSEAERLLGTGNESVRAARPLRHGVIADLDLASEMLRRFLRSACGGRPARSRLIVSAPSGATGIETRALEEACLAAGARHVSLIEKPLAAAAGAGLPIAGRVASLLLDVGGGTSEAAVISMGEIVVGHSSRTGGEELDQAIIKHLKREHGVLISERTAEKLKREVGSAIPNGRHPAVRIAGRDAHSGQPVSVPVRGEEIRGSLERPVVRIIETVKDMLAHTPPELGAEIIDRGITLVGGGSLLHGLEERLREEMQIPAHLAEMPHTCVAAGSGKRLEQIGDGALPSRLVSTRG